MGARIDHAGKEVEGVVCVRNDDKQRRFPVAQRVQLQLVIRRDLPKLLDVEGGKARTAANQNTFRCFARDKLSRTFSSNSQKI